MSARVALVTGSAGGLGAAIVAELVGLGHQVVAVDQREQDTGNDRVLPMVLDLTDVAAIEPLVAEVADRFGRIDVLVNNAAVAAPTPVAEITPEEWDLVQAVNLRAPFFLTRAVSEHMRRNEFGRVVNVASIAGQAPRPSGVHYGASKAGLVAITRVFATELAAAGITVNAVAPAMIDTPMVHAIGERALAELVAAVPINRITTAEEVASLIGYLVGDAAAAITGATMDVNGGVLMR